MWRRSSNMRWTDHLQATSCGNSWTGPKTSWLTSSTHGECSPTSFPGSLSNIGKKAWFYILLVKYPLLRILKFFSSEGFFVLKTWYRAIVKVWLNLRSIQCKMIDKLHDQMSRFEFWECCVDWQVVLQHDGHPDQLSLLHPDHGVLERTSWWQWEQCHWCVRANIYPFSYITPVKGPLSRL